MFSRNAQGGQTLVEMVVVIVVAIIVVAALVFATIASLRNAQFSKNQALATKLSQEGLEKIRSVRDRDGATTDGAGCLIFSCLYTKSFGCASNCYFRFSGSTLTGGTSGPIYEVLGAFERVILIEDGADLATEKKITSVVRWSDFSGTHESRLSTYLRKL